MANIISDKIHTFILARLDYVKSLKNPTDTQILFAQFSEKYLSTPQEMTAADLRNLKTLALAEQADEKAQKAKSAARKMISEQNEKNRKQRTHNLINSAGILGLAGLVDKTTGKPTIPNSRLLGALTELANKIQNATEQETAYWDELGSKILETARAEKNKTN